MAQLSRRLVYPDVENKMERLLVECVAKCRDQETTIAFIEDLLTRTEKIMLAKRISIALMLLKDRSYEEISQKLKVSVTTIWRIKAWLSEKGSGFRKLLEDVVRDDEEKERRRKELIDAAENDNPIWRGKIDWSGYKKSQWDKVRKMKKEPF